MKVTPAEVSDATFVYCLNLLKQAPKCRKAEHLIRSERLRLQMKGELPTFNPIFREPKLPFLRRAARFISRIDQAMSKYDNRALPEWVHETAGFWAFIASIVVVAYVAYGVIGG